MEFDCWFSAVESNFLSLSRTAKGVGDGTSSPHKPKLLIADGPQLAEKVKSNLRNAAGYLWQWRSVDVNRLDFHFVAEQAARHVSAGLLSEERSIYRTWSPQGKYLHWPKPHQVESEWSDFCRVFSGLLRNNSMKPFVLAADLERSVDLVIHPFEDGCGRTGKLLSSFVLLRHDLMPPLLTARDEYYKKMNGTFQEWVDYYEKCMMRHVSDSA